MRISDWSSYVCSSDLKRLKFFQKSDVRFSPPLANGRKLRWKAFFPALCRNRRQCWRPPGIGGNDFPLTSSPAGLGRRGRTASRPTRLLSSGGRSRWTAMPATTEMLGDFVRAALGNMPSVQRSEEPRVGKEGGRTGN